MGCKDSKQSVSRVFKCAREINVVAGAFCSSEQKHGAIMGNVLKQLERSC